MQKYRVLILCTGNSCRSQMAEGWVRHLLGDRVEVASAGTHPAGYVHPMAIKVMAEEGVIISRQRSKSVAQFANDTWDLVITVCDSAREECPYFPGAKEQIHISFPDPALVGGPREMQEEAYRTVRDAIRQRLVPEVERRCRAWASGSAGAAEAASQS
ncbi:MAG: arsenate reductase ArsC [Acidobacteriota bacterium]